MRSEGYLLGGVCLVSRYSISHFMNEQLWYKQGCSPEGYSLVPRPLVSFLEGLVTLDRSFWMRGWDGM